jgi:hypothetical protein
MLLRHERWLSMLQIRQFLSTATQCGALAFARALDHAVDLCSVRPGTDQ